MSGLIVGMDIGGTKVAVRAERSTGERVVSVELDARGWSASPVDGAVSWIRRTLDEVLDGHQVLALGVGAQGCDTQLHCAALEAALTGEGLLSVVVNDAALLIPAAGLEKGIGVIAGTGSIAVGASASGDALIAGGWGWVLGDDAGAPGLVREATRAALQADDEGRADDGLLAALQDAFAVRSPQALARSVNDEPTPEHWGPRAPAVFAAADAGSERAISVVDRAAAHLAQLVDQLVERGAQGDTIVAAGSVIAHQPRLVDAFRSRIASRQTGMAVQVLEDAPVRGGIELAKRRLRDGFGDEAPHGRLRTKEQS